MLGSISRSIASRHGRCLVTTPEQTVLDLENLRCGRAAEDDAREAKRALLPRCDETTLAEIAATQRLGRALSRTHLSHARLSEDIDLIATGSRREIAERLVRVLDPHLRSTIGRPR